jgi:hypothetical protein
MSVLEPYPTLTEFEPFWWTQHKDPTNRKLHVVGSTFAMLCWAYFMWNRDLIWIIYGLLFNYGFAWNGHYFYEGNRPATFRYPWWSLY